MSEPRNRFIPTDRDKIDDAAARRWAREMHVRLENGDVADDSADLATRLAEERAKKNPQQ